MPIIHGRDMTKGKSLTIRLEPEQVEILSGLAEQTGLSWAEVIRRLIDSAQPAMTVVAGVRLVAPKGDPLAVNGN